MARLESSFGDGPLSAAPAVVGHRDCAVECWRRVVGGGTATRYTTDVGYGLDFLGDGLGG
jgi:hypothetical protein